MTPSSSLASYQSSPLVNTNVLQRNLLQENIDRQTIIENYESYCLTCVETREFTHPTPEVCTAPKNRGGGGAEDDVNLNAVAVAAHRLKAFRVAARPHRASYFTRDGAVAPPGCRPAAAL